MKMTFRLCYKLLAAVLLMSTLLTTATVSEKQTKKPPHIVFILADDVGWADVSWHNPRVLTPAMENLARKGVMLEQSYVLPRCTPTRAALLTGRHPYTYGRQSRVIKAMEPAGVPLRFKLLPQTLKEAGYSTHAVGKWHLGFCSEEYTPTRRGFDSFYGFYSGSQDYFKHSFPYNVPTCPERRCKRKATKIGLDLHNNTAPDSGKSGIYSTHLFTSHVEDLLHSRDEQKPIFLYIAYQSAHAPLQVPTEYLNPFRSIKDKKRRTKLGMLLALDEAVGRVVEALKTSGHYENSVIIFSSDNGPPSRQGGSNWPLCGKKGSLLEGSTRGVAFVHSPLLKEPYISEKLIHVTDWYSTLTGLATGRAQINTDGYDQWRAISTPSVPSPRRKMIYNINFVQEFQAAVRENDFKLLIGASNNKRFWIHPPENADEKENKLGDETASSDHWNQQHNIPAISLIQNIGSSNNTSLPSRSLILNTGSSNNTSIPSRGLIVNTGSSNNTSIQHINLIQNIGSSNNTSIPSRSLIVNTDSSNNTSIQHINLIPNTGTSNNTIIPHTSLIRNTGTPNNTKTVILHSPLPKREARHLKRNGRRNKKKGKGKEKLEKADRADDWVTFAELGLKVKKYPRLSRYINRKTRLVLFNVKDDQGERSNIAQTNVKEVKKLLKFLERKMKHYVPAKVLPSIARGHPKYWNSVWSPGWCQARR